MQKVLQDYIFSYGSQEHPRHHQTPDQDLNYMSPDQYEFLQSEFTVPRPSNVADPNVDQEMVDILEGTNDLSNRVSDIKNRMELHRMLAEYEQQNRLMQGQPNTFYEIVNDEATPSDYQELQAQQPPFFQRDFRRDGSHFKERHDDMENNEQINDLLNGLKENEEQQQLIDEGRSTSFRELAKNENIPTSNVQRFQMEEDVIPSFFNGKNEHHRRMFDYEDTNADELPTVYLSPRDQLSSYRNDIPEDGVYTEGGLVYVPGTNKNDATTSLLQSIMGFTRHERLDVKKPGPQPPKPPPSDSSLETPKVDNRNLEQLPEHMKSEVTKKQVHSIQDDHANFSVDTEYAHVILKNSLDNWKEGARIVAALGEMLNLQNYFTHTRVDRHEVSFRVEPNPEKKTALDVAKSINDSRFKNNLSRRLGVLVLRAGVGDKVKDYENDWNGTKVEAVDEPNWSMIVVLMIIFSTLLAISLCALLLLIYRRVSKRRDKLSNLQAGLSGAETTSKDYQELCRARMAGKNETSTARVASLSKENDRPPSSRSSTSSWSEEPALSNMDISTGHMVLSYMEDHLRNKGRLQREWEALCRYEAEPNAREAALQPECSTFNRIGAPLPFDHSRVVLNHLANAEGMDYINASTIVSFHKFKNVCFTLKLSLYRPTSILVPLHMLLLKHQHLQRSRISGKWCGNRDA
jgi:receptor-type tyrosine-protein phosphatase N